ncbi:MAG TPA: hypothetical protein VFC00_31625 [Micromonosporaceae bacterium]|nr:hypothetical protein [Micromonosporaceae bacterium]
MTEYLIAVLTVELHRAALYRDRYTIASRLTGRRISDLDQLSTDERHRMIRAVRMRVLVP